MRKLVIFVSAFSISTLLAVYLLPALAVVILAGISALAAAGFVFLSGKARSRYFIICTGLAAGFLYFFIHASVFTYPAQKLCGTTEEITATVVSYPTEYTAVVNLQRENAPHIRTSLYCPNGFPQEAQPGDTVTATADFRNAHSSYYNGIKLYAMTSTVNLTKGSGGIRYLPLKAAHQVKEIIDSIFPEDTKALAKALVMGDTADFYNDTLLESAFRRAGLTHIVSVSGMHLTFIISILAIFIRNRRRRSVISIPIIIFFAAFVGFTPSVCRAGIMHLCIAAANLSKREPDDLTSLFASVFLIILTDPYAVCGVSLQLSFAAMLGIIVFTPRIHKVLSSPIKDLPKIPGRVLNAIISIFAATVGALVFTIPLSAIYFGQVSVAAPITSLLTLGVLSLAFSLCILACLLAAVFLPAGTIAAGFASLFLRYIMWIAKCISNTDFAAIYTSDALAVICLILTYAAFIAVFLLKKSFRAYIIPICMSVASVCIIILAPSLRAYDTSLNMTALDVGQGQCIVVTTGTMTAVIDCGSNSGEDAGQIASDYLRSRGISTIDILILTHYHSDHVNGVVDLISQFKTRTFLLPPMEDYTEYDDKILDIAKKKDGNIVFIEDDIFTDLGETELMIYPPLVDEGENERCAAVLCSNNGYDILITGDMPAYCESVLLDYAHLPDIEVLIAGHHGSSGSSSERLLEELQPETAVISVGRNIYGHPSEETLERFEKYGIMVLRTDIIGNVVLD